jgi:hypothetical protein
MAGFKEQIKARFKVKFPTVTLSKKRLEAISDKLDAKTDSEEDIDTKLDELNDLIPFADIAKQDDKIRDLETKVKEVKPPTETENADPDKKDPENKDPKKDEVPAWAKGLTDTIQTLSTKLSAIEGEKTTTSRKGLLTEKLKDAPEAFKNKVLKDFGRMKFDTDEDFEEYLTDTVTDMGIVVQEESNNGLGNDKPAGGLKKPASDKEVSSAMKELIAERTAKAEAKATKTV